jgi:FkbM family methyltransferase
MSLVEHVVSPLAQKVAFHARKLPWTLGLKSRFNTRVGLLTIPGTLVSPAIFFHLMNGDYESPELALLDQYLSVDDSVIELGAGIGFLANRYGKHCPHQRHLAIEASPIMVDLVRTNTKHLGNVDVINAVAARPPVSAAAGRPDESPHTVDFHVYSDFWASSTQPLHLTNPQRQLVRTVQVDMIDLDEVIASRHAQMLVCDIEGGEYDLVRTFDLNVPKILMELHWHELGMAKALSVLRILEERGYRLLGSPDAFMAMKP